MKAYLYEYRVRRVRRSCAAEVQRFHDPGGAANAFRTFTDGEPRELFLCASLDAQNLCLGIEVVAIGCMTGVEVHPREVFRAAILVGAAAIIVGHNHPSGDTTPSQQDMQLTRRLCESGELLGIPLLDHIIVGEGYTSFAQRGLM